MRLENDSIYFERDRPTNGEGETTVQLSEIGTRTKPEKEEEASSKFLPSPKEEFKSGAQRERAHRSGEPESRYPTGLSK